MKEILNEWKKYINEAVSYGNVSYSYSPNLIEFIKNVEGFSSIPYQNPGDKPTIGYGTTLYVDKNGKKRKVTMQDTFEISKELAEEYLKNYLDFIVMPSLNNYLKNVKYTQNQIDALASIMYNKGNTSFLGSPIFTIASKNPNDPKLKNAFLADAKGAKGMLKRRQEEWNLFSSKGVEDYIRGESRPK